MFFICFIRRGMLNFFHKLILNMGVTMLLYAFFVSHASLCSFSGKKKHIKSLPLRKNICFIMQNQAISRYRAQIKICLNQLLYAFSLDTISRVKFCLPSGIDYPVRSFMVADFLIKIIVAAGHVFRAERFEPVIVSGEGCCRKTSSPILRNRAEWLHIGEIILRDPPHTCIAYVFFFFV